MRSHMERAIEFATEQGRSGARCEILAWLALESGRIGASRGDELALQRAERAAREALTLAEALPGHPPWAVQAHGALARAALARGALEQAAEEGQEALRLLEAAVREDMHLETVLPPPRAFCPLRTMRRQRRLVPDCSCWWA